jgi:hypothetical protein
MTTLETYESLFARLLQYPRSRACKLILADFCLDQGDTVEEEFWRWVAEHNLYPEVYRKNNYRNRGKDWRWWQQSKDGTSLKTYSRLPFHYPTWGGVLDDSDNIDGHPDTRSCFPLVFFSPRKAWTEIRDGWKRMTDEQRQECRRTRYS